MGLSFGVESIIPVRNRPRPPQWYVHQAFIVEQIRKRFGWEKVPWEEPSSKTGLVSSCGLGGFTSLIGLGITIANEIDARHLTFHQVSQRIVTEKGSQKFPHFLCRSDYTNLIMLYSIYLPIEFEIPFSFVVDYPEYIVTVGSSARLEKELTGIKYYLNRFIKFQSEKMEYLKFVDFWESEMRLLDLFIEGCQDSQVKNLPFQLTY
jgi:hypothetical protein